MRPWLELRPDALTTVSLLSRNRVPCCDITAIAPPRLWTGGRLRITCASRPLPILPAAPRTILWPCRGDALSSDTEYVIRWWQHYRAHAAPYRLWSDPVSPGP